MMESLFHTIPKILNAAIDNMGTTIGNAVRRTLVSSIEGTAVTAVRIEGAAHRQVVIEARIVEVSLREEFHLGIDWSRVPGTGGGGTSVSYGRARPNWRD